jgi:hypothetical protein
MCRRAPCNLVALGQKSLRQQGAGNLALADDIPAGHRALAAILHFKAGAHPTLSHRKPVIEPDGPDTVTSGGGGDCAVLYKGQGLSPGADSFG